MSLTPGVRLGPYEVLAPVGAGGMGEVYKARDTRLDRTVAIKVLPAQFAAEPQFRERFEREAKAISQLSHPHICTLHDVGRQDGIDYLVMEYLEGQTLAQRLGKGALPLDQALQYAIQIADALDKAHRQGIIHRDLKPGNIMLTKSGTKLLDFGLAKTRASAVAGAGLSMLPTTPPNLTAQGSILGTLQYMAPEQLEGHDPDARTDLFAFGAVLFEILTGKKAFEGKSQASLIGAILKDEPPPISQVQPLAPPALDHVVKSCLAKDPDDRWQSASDLMRELKWIADTGPQAGGSAPVVEGRHGRAGLAWSVAAVSLVIAALALGTVLYLRRAPADTRAYRSSIFPPAGVSLAAVVNPNARFTLSPDGRRLAFVGAETGGVTRLWVRPLDGLSAQPLAGTEGAAVPFWSPDSRFIGFFAGGKVQRIDATGGPPLTLVDTSGATQGGATWNRDGVILFASLGPGNPIRRVSASGGAPSPVTMLNVDNGETRHAFPFLLPDGRHFLYLAVGSKTASANSPNGIYVTALDSNERKLLVPGGSNAMYAQGYLLFLREQTLMAQPFDVERLELTGDAVPIAERVSIGGQTGMAGGFTVSQSGVLAYQAGSEGTRSQLIWFDRTGKQIAALGDQADYGGVELSPDGTRAAVNILDPARRTRDIWLYDVARGLRTRFTFDPADEGSAVWSPDGSRIGFNSARKGPLGLYVKASSGAGNEELLLDEAWNLFSTSWSPDGRSVLYFGGRGGSSDLRVVPLSGDRKASVFLQTPFNEVIGLFSPDGRWIAYQSNESGRNEVYVAPFPGPGGKWQISTAGGVSPRWRRDGREMYYLAPDNRLMAALVSDEGSAFQVGVVRVLFETRPRPGANASPYDVSADGQRFLVNTFAEETTSAPITLVVNWPALLKK